MLMSLWSAISRSQKLDEVVVTHLEAVNVLTLPQGHTTFQRVTQVNLDSEMWAWDIGISSKYWHGDKGMFSIFKDPMKWFF